MIRSMLIPKRGSGRKWLKLRVSNNGTLLLKLLMVKEMFGRINSSLKGVFFMVIWEIELMKTLSCKDEKDPHQAQTATTTAVGIMIYARMQL